MLPIILGIVAVIVVVVLILGFSRPSTFRVERSITVNVPAEMVYALLTDFRRSEAWSPWEKKDLNMKKTFSGPATGLGSTFEWEGNQNVGHGRQEIVEAVPCSKVTTRLNFYKPFKGENMAEFLFEPTNGGTLVHWVMYGPLNFIVRVLCFNMDKMIGKDFEEGLASIKVHLEK
ncbi:MAG: SRPBCC family protein [Planctomycetales bacterium]|nr:SRPBCC family protein [Planctomycetales bacterium]